MELDTNSVLIGGGIGLVAGTFGVIFIFNFAARGVGGLRKLMAVARRASDDLAFAAKVAGILAGAELKPIEPPKPAKPSGAPLRMLALLQAEARLVDFLLEDISAAADAQIGQAVREIHKKAQAALKQHAAIEPVLAGNEGETATVPRGFDPSAIRVVGNVTGEPPFIGQINHPGWRVAELKLADPPEGADEFVLQPAEVQVV